MEDQIQLHDAWKEKTRIFQTKSHIYLKHIDLTIKAFQLTGEIITRVTR